MLHARRPRWRLLPATLVLAALEGVVGCGSAPTGDDGVDLGSALPTPEADGSGATPRAHLPQCARYQDKDPDLYGYCIYKYAGGFPTIEDVNDQCSKAGKWEADCRHAWVAGRMARSSGVDMDTLLGVCADNADCAFELLDFRPSNEVTVQMKRCLKHTGPHADDCTSHAMQRWYLTKPTAKDVAFVLEFETPYFDKVGYWVGAVVQCQGKGACPDGEQTGKFCRHAVETFERVPQSCPKDTKQPLPHNRGRPGHGGAKPPKAPEGSRAVPGSMPNNKPQRPPKGAKASGRPPGQQPPQH